MNNPILTPAMKPARNLNKTIHAYGADLLAFILRIDAEVYGLMTNEELSLIDHVAHDIIRARDMAPAVRERISDVRHRVLHTLRVRAAETHPIVPPPVPPAGREKENLGPMAPIEPAPIVRPPSPAVVDFAF